MQALVMKFELFLIVWFLGVPLSQDIEAFTGGSSEEENEEEKENALGKTIAL